MPEAAQSSCEPPNQAFTHDRSFLKNAYRSCVDTLEKVVFKSVPTALTAAIIAIEMPAAIKPYSIAVAPDSFFRNEISFCIAYPPTGLVSPEAGRDYVEFLRTPAVATFAFEANTIPD